MNTKQVIDLTISSDDDVILLSTDEEDDVIQVFDSDEEMVTFPPLIYDDDDDNYDPSNHFILVDTPESVANPSSGILHMQMVRTQNPFLSALPPGMK